MNQIQKINYLILEYEKGNYRTETFCDEFVRVLYHEKDDSVPHDLFEALKMHADVFSRFSQYEEDLKMFPNTYYDDETVSEQIDIAIENLGMDI